jgi:hypothetical protein
MGEIALLSVMLMAITGCQAITKEEAAPTPIVVVTREATCPIENFEEQESTSAWDLALLKNVDRAFVVKGDFTCEDEYIKGKLVALQDGYVLDTGKYYWTGFYEIITDEGGIWKGTCENTQDAGSVCKFNGESKYKGQQMSLDISADSVFKFTITKLVEE